MWAKVYNLVLTVSKMYPYSNLENSVIRSPIFSECSLYLKKTVPEF